MRKLRNRLLSLVLVVAMVVSMVPNVFATDAASDLTQVFGEGTVVTENPDGSVTVTTEEHNHAHEGEAAPAEGEAAPVEGGETATEGGETTTEGGETATEGGQTTTEGEKKDETASTEGEKKDESASTEEKKDETASTEEKKDETASTEEKKDETASTEGEKKDETTSTEEKKDETASTEGEKKDETTSTEGEKKDETKTEEKKEETLEAQAADPVPEGKARVTITTDPSNWSRMSSITFGGEAITKDAPTLVLDPGTYTISIRTTANYVPSSLALIDCTRSSAKITLEEGKDATITIGMRSLATAAKNSFLNLDGTYESVNVKSFYVEAADDDAAIAAGAYWKISDGSATYYYTTLNNAVMKAAAKLLRGDKTITLLQDQVLAASGTHYISLPTVLAQWNNRNPKKITVDLGTNTLTVTGGANLFHGVRWGMTIKDGTIIDQKTNRNIVCIGTSSGAVEYTGGKYEPEVVFDDVVIHKTAGAQNENETTGIFTSYIWHTQLKLKNSVLWSDASDAVSLRKSSNAESTLGGVNAGTFSPTVTLEASTVGISSDDDAFWAISCPATAEGARVTLDDNSAIGAPTIDRVLSSVIEIAAPSGKMPVANNETRSLFGDDKTGVFVTTEAAKQLIKTVAYKYANHTVEFGRWEEGGQHYAYVNGILGRTQAFDDVKNAQNIAFGAALAAWNEAGKRGTIDLYESFTAWGRYDSPRGQSSDSSGKPYDDGNGPWNVGNGTGGSGISLGNNDNLTLRLNGNTISRPTTNSFALFRPDGNPELKIIGPGAINWNSNIFNSYNTGAATAKITVQDVDLSTSSTYGIVRVIDAHGSVEYTFSGGSATVTGNNAYFTSMASESKYRSDPQNTSFRFQGGFKIVTAGKDFSIQQDPNATYYFEDCEIINASSEANDGAIAAVRDHSAAENKNVFNPLTTNTFGSNTDSLHQVKALGDGNYRHIFGPGVFDITWKDADGEVLGTTEVKKGVVPTFTAPTKAANAQYTYTFAGWTPEVVGATEDTTYTASYSSVKNKYTVTWNLDGKTYNTQKDVEWGTKLEDLQDPTKEGYTFSGWTGMPEDNIMPAENLTITGTFTANTYDITLDKTGEGSVSMPQTAKFGDTVKVTVKADTDYKLTSLIVDGKNVTVDANGTYTFTMPSHSVSITAEFKEIPKPTYTVTWKDGDTVKTETYVQGAEIKVPVPDAKTGYTFDGWFNGEEKLEGTVTATGDVTYTAKWTINKYTITWKNENGSELEVDKDVPYGTTPSYDGDTPTKAADAQYTYTFAGWDPAVVAATEDATYTATYKASKVAYSIGTGAQGEGTVEVSSKNSVWGETITVNVTPAEGYKLTKVLRDNEVELTVENGETTFEMPAKDVIVYAYFAKIDYTVSVDGEIANGTVSVDKETANIGDEITVTVEPEKYYTLSSLTVAGETVTAEVKDGKYTFTMPAKNVEITATFTYTHQHNYTAREEIVEEATCTEAGQKKLFCECGASVTEEIPIDSNAHDWNEGSVTAPTCTDKGYTTYTCKHDANHTYVDNYTEALEHTPAAAVKENVVPATCTAEGSYDEVVYCSVETCKAEISREKKTTPVDAEAHKWVFGHTVAATCTAGGHDVYTCDNGCGKTDIRNEVSALGHTAGEAVKENEKAATCTAEGSYDLVTYCSVCKAEMSRKTETIKKLAHTEVIDEAVAATCTSTGLTEGKHCSVCNTVITAQESVDALGHDYDEGVITTEPQVGKEGVKTFTCKNDPTHTYTESVPALVAYVAAIGETKFETLTAAFAAAQNGETVTLVDDIAIDTETITIADGKAVTLDMNGKTITVTDNRDLKTCYELFYIYGELAVTGNGTIELTATNNDTNWAKSSSIFHNRGGKLTIENGTFTHKGGTGMAYVVDNSGNHYGDATTNINGGTLTSTYTAIRNRMEQNTHGASGKAILNISGGTITGTTSAVWAQAASTSTTAPATGEINISGGEVGIVNTARSAGAVSMTTVTGGSVAAFKGEVGELTVKGGTVETVTILTAAGEAVDYVVDENGTYVEASYAATVNGKGYETFEAALAAAKGGDTLTLLADVTASSIITINKAITLDGNGKTLTSTAGRAINVDGADGVTVKNLTINCSGERAINVIQNATNVTLDNVTATAANYTVNVAASALNAVVAVKNSTLTGLCTVNVSAAGAAVTVADSTVNCNDNNTTAGEAYAALSLNKEAVGGSIVATNTVVNVPAGSDSSKGRNSAENGTVTINGSTEDVTVMVAAITYAGSDYYHTFTTLAAAIEFAKAGDTVTLLRDVTETQIITIDKAIALDGNGKTLTSTAGRAINVETDGQVTISNLTIAAGERAINIINKPATVKVNNVTATASNNAVMIATSAGAVNLSIADSDLTGLAVVNVAGAGAQVEIANTKVTNKDASSAESYGAITVFTTATNATVAVTGGEILVADDSNKAIVFASSATVTGVDDVKTVVATVGDAGFFTIEEAIEAAKAGETVTLQADITASAIITINKAIALDGNGKTLTSTAGRAINVVGADGVTVKNLTINCSGERAINVIQNATNVTIENVTATAANYTVNVAASAPNAVVAVKNSTLTGLNVVNVGAAGANVTVTGGTIVCNDQNAAENYAALCLNKDAVNGKITATGVTFDIKGESAKASNGAEGGSITIDGTTEGVETIVAVITYPGSSNYYSFATLESAITAAQAGDTVTLLADVALEANAASITVDKGITIDGNGKTVTADSATSAFVIASSDVTFKNMTIAQGTQSNSFGISINKGAWNAPAVQYSDVTIENVVFNGGNYALCLIGEDVTVTGCTFNGQSSHNILVYSLKGESNITNNTFNASTGSNKSAILYEGGADNATDLSGFIGGGKLNISGNTANAKGVFFQFTSWKLVKGMELTITGNKVDGTTNKVIALYDMDGAIASNGDEFASVVINQNVFTNTKAGRPILKEYTGKIAVDASANYLGSEAPDYAALLLGDKVTVDSYYTDEALTNLVSTAKPVATVDGVEYKTLQEAIDAADGKTVTLLADTEFGGCYITANITVDLNGKEITSTGDYFFWIEGGSLTLKDSVGTGKLNGVTTGNAVLAYGDATFIMEGGTILSNNNVVTTLGTGNTVVINGGKLEYVINSGAALYLAGSESTVTVNGGTVLGNIPFNYGTLIVKGGLFTKDVSAYCAAGYAALLNADGLYEIVEVTAENAGARIGTTYYATVAAALTAATEQDTIVVLRDFTGLLPAVKGTIVAEDGATVTINATNTDWVYMGDACTIGEGVNLNVPNGGLFVYSDAAVINGTVVTDAYYQRYADSKLTINAPGSLKVTSETFILRYTDGDAEAGIYINGDNNDETVELDVSVVYFYQGTISAKDATIKTIVYWQTQETDGQGSANLVLDHSKLTVTGSDEDAKATGNSYVTLKNDSHMTIADDFIFAEDKVDVRDTSTITYRGGKIEATFVAEVGGVKYTSLQDAENAAKDGETIVLLTDIELDGKVTFFNSASARMVTLDMNGKTITLSADWPSATDPCAFWVCDGLTITGNGTINAAPAGEAWAYAITVGHRTSGTTDGYVGNLVIENGTFYSDNASVVSVTNGTAVINGGTFESAGDMDLNCVDDMYAAGKASITVNGGTFVDFNPADNASEGANTNFCADGITVVAQQDGTYLAGKLPEADVTKLGKVTVGPNAEGVFKTDSFYKYDLVGSHKLETVNGQSFDLTLAMNFKAKDDAQSAAANAFGGYTTDFYITMNGMADGSFVADGCYLAGYYPSFKTWVVIPMDGFTVEDGKVYPVISSAGFDFKYTDICGSVKDFLCGIYLTPEVLNANPNLSVDLDLGLTETLELAQNATGITKVDGYTYTAEELLPFVPVATIGTAKYATLEDAVKAAKAGDTIELLADVTAEAVILLDKSVTINGNGHKVTSSATRVFRVTASNAVVTMNGVNMVSNAVRVGQNDIRGISLDSGLTGVEVTLNNCSVDFTDASANDWAYAVNVTGGNGYKVTVSGGTYEGANVINVRGENQTVVVENATLTSNYPNNDMYYGACIYVVQEQGSSVTATGNTFNGSNAVAFNIGTGTALTESGNTDNTTKVVAKIGSEYYTSLADAFAAGGEITLLHSVELTEALTVAAGKTVVLNLNGKTISGTSSESAHFALITNNGTLTVQDSVGGGKISYLYTGASSNYSFAWGNFTVLNSGNLTVESGTIENTTNLAGHMLSAIDNRSGGTVTVGGGTVSCPNYVAIRQFATSATADNTVVINGGTVTGKFTLWPQNATEKADTKATLTVNGGTVTGTSTALYLGEPLADTFAITKADAVTIAAPEDYKWVNGKLTAITYVAEVAGTKYETLEEAFAAGGEITLLADVTLTETVNLAAGKTATLDLSGKTVAMADASGKAACAIKNNGDLTITDSVGGGKITFNTTTASAANSYASNTISNYGAITVKGGTIENTSVGGGACYALDNYAGSTATIEGGRLVAEKTTARIFNWTNGDAAKATLNVTGGEILSKDGYGINLNMGNAAAAALNIEGGTITTNDTDYALAVYVVEQGSAENLTINVTGGTFNGNFALNGKTSTTMKQGAVSVTGGTFTGVICYGEPAYGFISGGTFATDVNSLCAAGYMTKANADGTYGVVTDPAYGKVAMIGETYFETLAEAAAAAQAGDEIKIIAAGSYNVPAGKNVTITGAVDGVVFDNIKQHSMAGASVTFNNVTFTYAETSSYMGLQDAGDMVYNNCTFNGQVFLYGQSETFNGCTFVNTNTDNYNVWTYAAKEVSFNDCTFNCGGRCVLVYNEGATFVTKVNVTDTEFVSTTAVDGKAAIEMDSSLSAGIELTVTNSTATGFGNGNVSGNSLWNNKKGNANMANNDITVTVDGTVVLQPWTPAAKIGTTEYKTFADALNAAKAGDTITLLADVKVTGKLTLTKSITIDGNGHSIIADETAVWYTVSGKLNVKNYKTHLIGVNADGITLKNIVLDNNNNAAGINIYCAQNVVFDNVSIINATKGMAALTVNGSTLTVKNAFTALGNSIAIDASNGSGVTSALGVTVEPGTVFDAGNKTVKFASVAAMDMTGAVNAAGEAYFAAKDNAYFYTEAQMESRATSYSNGLTLLTDVELSKDLSIKGTLDLNGKTLTLAEGKIIKTSGNLTVKGGTVAAPIVLTAVSHTVTGPEGLNVTTTVADHKVVYANGVYTVVAKIYVAEVNGTKYETFAEAAANIATDGSDTTIKLLTDIELTESIDFNYGTGKVIFTADAPVTVKQTKNGLDLGFVVGKAANIVVEENVTFEISDNAAGFYMYYGPSLTLNGTLTGGANWGCAYLFNGDHVVSETGKLTVGRVQSAYNTLTVNGQVDTNYLLVESGTFTADGAIVDANVIFDNNNGGQRWGASQFAIKNGSEVTTSKLTLSYADSTLTIDGTSKLTAAATAGAGKIVVDATGMTAGETDITVGDTSAFTGEIELVNGGNMSLKVVDGKIVLVAPVAKIGETYFATLAEAAAAAQNGDVITMIDNTEETAEFTLPNVTLKGNGKTITLAAAAVMTVNDATFEGVTLNGTGTAKFYGTVNFYGTNNVTPAIGGSPFHLVVNENATLLVTRFVLGYGRAITVNGTIADASALTAADVAAMTPSLKFNSTSGVSVGGTETGELTVNNAYVDLGGSSWKTAQGTYNWTLTNSYVKATSLGNNNAPGSDSAKWTVTFDDCQVVASNYLKTGKGTEYIFTNGSTATTGSIRIDGALTIDETATVTVNAYQNNKRPGVQDEHGDISGTVTVGGKLDITGGGNLGVEVLGGSINVLATGELTTSHAIDLYNGELKVHVGGKATAKAVTGEGTITVDCTAIAEEDVNYLVIDQTGADAASLEGKITTVGEHIAVTYTDNDVTVAKIVPISGKVAYRAYITDSASREAVQVDLENVNAKTSLVIKLLDAQGNVLTTTTLKAGGVRADNYTANIVLAGTPSGSWDTVIDAEKLTVANAPATIEVWADGQLTDSYTNAMGDKLDAYKALDCVHKEAKIGNTFYATLEEAIAAAQAGETVTLLDDATLAATQTIEKAITLDLGGKTVTGADGAIVFNVKADTAILNGSVKGNKSGTSSGLIDIYADVTLTGVTVETSKINALRFKAGDCTATLTDCSVTGAFKGYGNSVWNIQSGTYKASSTSINEQLNGTAAVSGGTFHYAIKETVCAPGYVVVDNTDGTYTVKYAPAAFVDADNDGVLDDGEAVYGSLEQIFANHKSGDVYVVLTADISSTAQVDTDADAKYYFTTNVAEGVTMDLRYADDWNYIQKASIGENITLNAKHLLGWTDLDVYGNIVTEYAYFMGADVLIAEGATLAAKNGEATIQVKDGAELTVNGTVETAILNVWVNDAALTVSGANAKVSAKWVDIWDGTPSVTVENGATLEGETVKASRGGSIAVADAVLTADAIVLGHSDGSVGTMTVTGTSTVSPIELTTIGSEVTGPEGMTVTTNVADHKVVYENGVYSVAPKHYVAQIGTAGYETLAEALAAAQAGETVTLLESIEVTEPVTMQDVTVDLATFTMKLTTTGTKVLGDVTIKNGTVDITDGTADSANNFFTVGGTGAALTLDSMTLTGENYTTKWAVICVQGGSTLDIKNSTVTLKNDLGTAGGFVKDSSGVGNADVVTITDSTVTLTEVDRGVTGTKLVLDNTDLTITGGEHGINGATLDAFDSAIVISDGYGRGLTVTTGEIFLDDSTITIENMEEAGMRFKKDHEVILEGRSSIEVENVLVDSGAELEDLMDIGRNASVTEMAVSVTTEDGTWFVKDLATAWAMAENGATITLLADVEQTASIKNTKIVTLDLNGNTVTGTDTTSKNFGLIDNTGDLTITDSVGTGKITLTSTVNSGWDRYAAVVSNNPGGKLTVKGGTLENLGGTDMAYGIDNLTNGTGTYAETVIEGGTVKSTYRGIRQFLNGEEAQNILTVTGGTVEGANKAIFFHDPSTKANSGKLTVKDAAVLSGDVYLFVTEGSTEWPVDVSVSSIAVGENTVESKNVPEGYEVLETNGNWIVEKSDEADLFSIFAANVSLGNNLNMKFAIREEDVPELDGLYATITKSYADGREDTVVTYPSAEWEKSGTFYVLTFKGIPAKEMSDDIVVTVYNANGEAVSKDWNDSMRAYVMRMLLKAETPVEKTALVDMLCYGAAAQNYFGYNTGDLATKLLTATQLSYASAPSTYNAAYDLGDKWFGSNLSLTSNIVYKLAFKDCSDGMYAMVEYTDHKGGSWSYRKDLYKSGSYHVADIDTLVIADGRQVITVTVYNADGTVFTTCQDSIEAYLVRKSAANSQSEVETAVMTFSDSAYAYLHRND